VVVIIYDIHEKGKNWLYEMTARLFVPILILLVGSGIYGAALLAKIEGGRETVTIEYPAQTEPKSQSPPDAKAPTQPGMYVTARGGVSYYLPWCSAVKRISEKNKVWFKTKEEAEQAGYKPATNCKGMK
jgi:hypothetical protein